MQIVRQPAVAGMFYPSNVYELEDELTNLLEFTRTDFKPAKIFGLISPHAGYIYSGKTAARAYNLLRNRTYETVIILSPSHREYFPGVSVFSGDAYKTPIGEVPLNTELKKKIITQDGIIFEGTQGHRSEHAVEVQIPFLQMTLKDFSILPLVIGDQRLSVVYHLADILEPLVDDQTLIVVSTDLSHFHTKNEANRLDSIVENRIKNLDYESLQQELDSRICEACGGGGIVTLLKLASMKNKTRVQILNRCDSGDITGDEAEVVGYLSAVIYE